jgi:MFS family permease
MTTATPVRTGRADFWKYWTGQTISNLGSSFTLFALPLLVFKLTGSALNLGITTAATFVPYLLFGLLIGAMTDRMNRKRLMIVTDLLRAVVIASIPLMYVLNLLTVEWIYGVAFVSSILTIFFTSAEFAVIPSLVRPDELITANGRIQASFSGASVLGPVLAGLLVAVVPLSDVLLADAASFVISSLSLALIRGSFNREDEPTERKHILRDVAEGLGYVLRHPVLRNISAMMAMVNFVTNAATSQLVYFAKRQLLATDSQVAFLFTAASLGTVVFALLAGPLRRRWSFGVVALGALAFAGAMMVGFSFQHMYWPALALWGIGSTGVLLDINTFSLRQAIVPNHLLGRVISIASVLAWSAIPLGAISGGLVVQETGNVSLVFLVVGVLSVLIPASFFFFSPLGHAERYLPEEARQALGGRAAGTEA